MENYSLKTHIEKLSQQVEDLQLRVSNADATKKKRVRFSDDSVSSAQLLQDALPSMSTSDLEDLGQSILRELAKRASSDRTSSTSYIKDIQPSSQTKGNVNKTSPPNPTSHHTPKVLSRVHNNDQPGTKIKPSGYMKVTAAADAKTRSRPASAAGGLVERPDTRTSTRPAMSKTSGRPTSGTREQPQTGGSRRSAYTFVEDLPPSPFNTTAAASKKGRLTPEPDKPALMIEDIAPTPFSIASAAKKARSIEET